MKTFTFFRSGFDLELNEMSNTDTAYFFRSRSRGVNISLTFIYRANERANFFWTEGNYFLNNNRATKEIRNAQIWKSII